MNPRILIAPLLAVTLCSAACGGADESAADQNQIRTIGREHVPATRVDADKDATGTDTLQGDEIALPFEPAISMDPVDGSKVSIRKSTPSTEYEGRIYHFSSEENMRLFLENPKKYLSGTLGTY